MAVSKLRIESAKPVSYTHLDVYKRQHFDIVNDRTNRDVLQRHGVAGLDVNGLVGGDDLVAGCQALRGQDVGLFAVSVVHQSDERRAVRVVFQTLDRALDVELATLEAVSYTHLDVYKRQKIHGADKGFPVEIRLVVVGQ